MDAPKWDPVYLTDDERYDIASNLIVNAEANKEDGQEDTARRLYYLAGLLAFATSEAVR